MCTLTLPPALYGVLYVTNSVSVDRLSQSLRIMCKWLEGQSTLSIFNPLQWWSILPLKGYNIVICYFCMYTVCTCILATVACHSPLPSVMRASGSYRLLLNTHLWAQMKCDRANQKSIRITAQTGSDGNISVFFIMVRCVFNHGLHG